MPSSFDPGKDAANRKKHGIPLTEGDGVLNDPLALTIEDSSSQGEQRFISIGINVFGNLRVVVYAFRDEDVRIISVRKAEPKEIRAYEKGI
ncbi:MAG: BrnT family toxin [Gammaproteobacteria bacterium]